MKALTKNALMLWGLLILGGVWIQRSDDFKNGFFYLNHQWTIKTLLQQISGYRHNGLISQLDKDMGDTLQRTGSYYTLLHFLDVEHDDLGRTLAEGYHQDMQQLTAGKGIYRRSNDPDYWGFDASNCSRDQIFAAQSAIVTFRDFTRGRELFTQFFKRGFLNQNIRKNWAYPGDAEYKWKWPDIPTPSQLSLLLRGLGSSLVYPVVFLLDAAMVVDVTLFRKLNARELWDYDIKMLPALIAANSYQPTIWSRLALKYYLQQRADVADRIVYYNQKQFNGIQPLASIYNLALDKMNDQFIAGPKTLGIPISKGD